ncbi:MAG TPA: ornithine carbamoyltransferase [Dehalococcoidia bacterium]|nr:ornithine carbamoyltransferase [Dehalococcoidia bacterium]
MAISGKNLLSIADLGAADIWHLIEKAIELKQKDRKAYLKGKVLALLFEKPSLRTRVSFEVAMRHLGGHTIYLSPTEVGLGKREQVPDIARTLSRYVDGIVARTFSHQTLELLARYAGVPVINGLSNQEHPCQALGDLLTIYEKKGKLKGLRLAFIGDGNNVAQSLVLANSLVGINFIIASPPDYKLQEAILRQAQEFALKSEAHIILTSEPHLAVKNADIVYTDVWVSMGQEAEAEARRLAFASYQVDAQLLSLAKKDALFMHPLPAHHGEEIAEGLLEHPQSVVFDQAENRLHIQKAILVELMGV